MSEKPLTEADLDRMDSRFRVPEDVTALVAEVRRLREAHAASEKAKINEAAHRAELERENVGLREALAPFAAIALHMKHTGQEALHADRLERLGWTVVLSDCKRAKEVLG